MVSFRPALWPTLMMVLMSTLMIYLGLWQKDRSVWKHNLLADIQKKWTSEPKPLPVAVLSIKGDKKAIYGEENSLSLLETHNMDLISVTGEFLTEPLFYRTANHISFGRGYEIVAGFKAEEGIIPISLGIIPAKSKESYLPPIGTLSVTGILRLPKLDNGTKPEHKGLIADIPFSSFYNEFSNELLPLYLTATTENHFDDLVRPRKIESFIKNIPNNHNTYMWTWFLLAGTLWVVYVAWHYHTKRLCFTLKKNQ